MKSNYRRALCFPAIIYLLLFLQFGCKKDNTGKTLVTRTYTLLKPIYKDKATFLANINGSPNQPVENAGKIYIKDHFIFLNEIDKGIHVFDNSNPLRPVQTAFLNIPGNQDIAVKGNILYADMYSDLLAIDITDVKHAHVTKSLYNLFTERQWVNGFISSDSNTIVADWIKKDTTVTDEYDPNPVQCALCYFDIASSVITPVRKSSAGVAGSMASMVLMDDYLYAITERHSLGVVKVDNPAIPSVVTTMSAGFDLETIYPFDGKLFLGSAVGLFMFDASDGEHPAQLGQFSHGRACDPVIADGKYAYVTLHAGTECGGAENELNVIDIQDLMNPMLVKSYPMTKPTGLSKDGNLLFICDGNRVKLFDASNASNVKLLNTIESNEPYDVIVGNKKALVVAKNGLYQYDYSNVNNIRQLSVISLKN